MPTLSGTKSLHQTDMTDGNIFRHLLRFTLPLLAGNLFQQMYNTVDTWVLGNFVGSNAFSAVGCISPLINTLIGTFSGLAGGAGVVISQSFGAKDRDGLNAAVSASLGLTAILSVIFTIIGLAMMPQMLALMKMPQELMPEAAEYLTICFCGITGLLFYNMCSGILRAMGDSRRPFYYLAAATVINTVLDLFFVLKLDMGVRGVAYATVIAQAVSALLAFAALATDDGIQLKLRNIRSERAQLKRIVCIGIPTALQMGINQFSNILVQAYINAFGADCMGGWTAFQKLDQLNLLPMMSVSIAVMTFVGQNLGGGKLERAKKGVRIGLAMSAFFACLGSSLIVGFASDLVRFFSDSSGIVEYGTLFVKSIVPFHIVSTFNHTYGGALRGMGNTKAPMLSILAGLVVFRQLYLYVVTNFISNTPLPVVFSYPAGWVVCSALMVCFYIHSRRKVLNRVQQ